MYSLQLYVYAWINVVTITYVCEYGVVVGCHVINSTKCYNHNMVYMIEYNLL